MNRAPLILLGLFCVLAFSWTGLLLTNQVSYGSLASYKDPSDEQLYPQATPGIAARGKLVYQELGCAACHTQQVRRPGLGADTARGWGERQSVARDYVRDGRVLLGSMRDGPDLFNVGARQKDPSRLYLHLFDPQLTTPGSNMPPFRFLFETRAIIGQPSPKALNLPAPYTAPRGYETVPTPRAEALVAYLTSLKHDYMYPEAKPHPKTEEKKEGEKK